MKNRFYASASGFAQSAMQAYLEKDWPVFLLHSATSLEQLAKAFLASKHPSLIAAFQIDSLLHACDLSTHAHTPSSQMRTINMREALERSTRFIPPLANLTQDLSLLMDVRNGLVHLGLLDVDVGQRLLVPFLKASAGLLESVGAKPPEYWGGATDFVEARLSESLRESEIRAKEAIASALLSFERKYGGIADPVLQDVVLKSIENSYSPEKYEQQLITCPACSHLALLSGTYEVNWEPDYDYSEGESFIAGVYPVVTFFPGHLDCAICGLELDGEDEIQAAGIQRAWDLEGVDPKDFYEPEEDWEGVE